MPDLAVIVCLAFDHRADSDGLAQFVACIAHCPFVDSTTEVSGTYDLIVHGHCASLSEYTAQMATIRPSIARYARRIEVNFVSGRGKSTNGDDEQALWLPCEGGRRRVDVATVDKVLAEGDYMRVHVGAWNCMVHLTMRQIGRRLKEPDFIKLHRSTLVRANFIERVVHKDRRWCARLMDETHAVIAQSRVGRVLRLIAGDSSKPRPLLPTIGGPGVRLESLAE